MNFPCSCTSWWVTAEDQEPRKFYIQLVKYSLLHIPHPEAGRKGQQPAVGGGGLLALVTSQGTTSLPSVSPSTIVLSGSETLMVGMCIPVPYTKKHLSNEVS